MCVCVCVWKLYFWKSLKIFVYEFVLLSTRTYFDCHEHLCRSTLYICLMNIKQHDFSSAVVGLQYYIFFLYRFDNLLAKIDPV